MKKVYLVSDGSYSDYHELGIYTTREKAERAHEVFNADNDIVKWELDVIPETPPGLLPWRVYMDKDGNTSDGKDFYSNGICRASANGFKPNWYPTFPFKEMARWVVFEVWAKDREHAVKVANERRLMLIASGEWTTDRDVYCDRMRAERKAV